MLDYDCPCPVEATLGVIGGKWKLLIYRELYFKGTLRYGTIRGAIPKISSKVLTQQLRELEADGVVERVVYPVIPPHVEYFLTDAGRSLQEVFLAMCRWGTAFLKHEYDFPQQHA